MKYRWSSGVPGDGTISFKCQFLHVGCGYWIAPLPPNMDSSPPFPLSREMSFQDAAAYRLVPPLAPLR